MNSISPETYRSYSNPLVENDLYRFDTSQDGSLKPVDFEGNEQLFSEFISRYAHSSKYIREKYRNNMSRNLEIEIGWNLVQLWRGPDLKSDEKDKIADVLKRDFRIKIKEVTDRESVLRQFFKPKYWTGVGGGIDTNEDPLRGSDSHSFSTYAYAGTYQPFRLFADRLLLAPNLNLSGNYTNGERKLEEQENESYDYFGGSGSMGLGLSDRQNERWSLNGSVSHSRRTRVPDGFFERSLSWNTSAGTDQPFGTPLSLSVSANGLREYYAPPAEADQNQKNTEELYAGTTLVANLTSAWAVILPYRFERQDNVSTYSSKLRTRHRGSTWFRRRSIDGYHDFGVKVGHTNRHKTRNTSEGVATEDTTSVDASLGYELFRFLGNGKSVDASFFLSGTRSRGDFEATYPGYSTSVTGSAYFVPDKLEGSITGEIDHSLIYQEDRDYELWYSASPRLTYHITDNFTIGAGSGIEQTRNTGGFDERSTSASGSAFANLNLDILNGLDITLSGYGGRSWDQNPNPNERFYDSRYGGGEIELSLSF